MIYLLEVAKKNAQFFRFVMAGSLAFTINLAVLYVLTDIFNIHYLISTAGAFLVAFGISFLLQKFWTFKEPSHEWLHIQVPLYLGMQLTNVSLNAALMFVFVEYLHIWYLSSQAVISLGLAAVIYFLNKNYVFKRREAESY